ncbi:hypothetical protein StrepF001_43345 [Streptomyces sp. F001]|uniref:hypothetical protein n=1 Tax=Streptomyces sp. F001 TaxID=1510026 RepID=UPI00101E65EC|nr:hypothetical protein [Streptomyces sp. F001]RZB13590.1 hypothetical protein StrepF001_43345 [Streptomyces sp. F001]
MERFPVHGVAFAVRAAARSRGVRVDEGSRRRVQFVSVLSHCACAEPSQIMARLQSEPVSAAHQVLEYERRHRRREMVISAAEERIPR